VLNFTSVFDQFYQFLRFSQDWSDQILELWPYLNPSTGLGGAGTGAGQQWWAQDLSLSLSLSRCLTRREANKLLYCKSTVGRNKTEFSKHILLSDYHRANFIFVILICHFFFGIRHWFCSWCLTSTVIQSVKLSSLFFSKYVRFFSYWPHHSPHCLWALLFSMAFPVCFWQVILVPFQFRSFIKFNFLQQGFHWNFITKTRKLQQDCY
jgi:hypothetical protein